MVKILGSKEQRKYFREQGAGDRGKSLGGRIERKLIRKQPKNKR